jgi:hypothetical protein
MINGLTFRVGALDYRITETPDLLRKHDLFDQVTYDDGLIEIEPTLSEQRKHNVIIMPRFSKLATMNRTRSKSAG